MAASVTFINCVFVCTALRACALYGLTFCELITVITVIAGRAVIGYGCGTSFVGTAGSNPALDMECYVLSSRDVWDGPIHRPEESFLV